MFPLVVFFIALALYLPFNSYIPITDPVEANYALTAKEMLTSGNWLSPQIYGQFWYDKPAMIYWLIAGSYKVFGIGEFAARFPAALFSAASVSFICWFGKRLYDNWLIGFFAAVVLATSLEYWVLARMIITDAVLFFFASVAMGTYYLGLIGQGKIWYALGYLFAGLAVLTKGPVGIVLPALTLFVYICVTRRWELFFRLFLLPGLAIFFLAAAPWYLAMVHAHGSEFVDTFLGLHNVLRATVSEHPKDNVFYYYLVLFPVSLLPWTGVFLRSLSGKKPPHFAYLAVWLAVIIVFYSLMATKYPTYVFPALFPAALLTGCQLEQMLSARKSRWLWLLLPALLQLAVFAAGIRFLPTADGWLVYLAVGIAVIVILWLQLWGDAVWMPWATGAAVVLTSLLLIYQGLVPLAETRSAKAVVSTLPARGAEVAAYGDYPTSAVFYSGYTIPRLQDAPDSAAAGVWAGKYTMPKETTASFSARTAQNPEVYILANTGITPPLEGLQPVAEAGKYTLYKRISVK